MKLPAFIQAATLLLIITVLSCSKSDDAPTPQPNPDPIRRVDTLTTGWTKVSVGKDVNFYDIFFQNENIGYTVGNKIYKTVNGGVSWDSISPNGGINLAVTPDGKIFYIDLRSTLWKSTDKGVSFSAINLSTTGNNLRLYDIFFTDNDSGYISSVKGELITTADGGVTWSLKTPSPDYSVLSEATSSLFFVNGTNGWVTNGSALSKTNGSTTSWTRCNVLTQASVYPKINSLYAPSANVVYAGCGNGALLKSTNSGLDFSVIKEFVATSGYLDTHFFDNENGYALFDRKIYKTSDGGINWQTVVTIGEGVFVELHFIDTNHGWACCNNGSILRFSN